MANVTSEAEVAVAVAKPAPSGSVRWVVCGLLFFATAINYIDRQVLGILAPSLQTAIGWTELQYGYIVTAFQAAYALGFLFSGRLLDWAGTRLGYAFALIFWSFAAMAHALARTPLGFGMARLALTFSWRAAFIATGAIGFSWLVLWLLLYHAPERHPRLSKAELDHIRSDPPDQPVRVSWLQLAGHREAWAFAIGKFITDPVWWFYLYWIPKFLNDRYGLTLSKLGPPLIVIYLFADVGSIGGGWLSSTLITRGASVNRARKTAMLVCALCVTPIVFVSRSSDLWITVGLISLAAAAHQGWSANLFTLASDMFPRWAVGSVVGMGGMAGAIGGMLVAVATGWFLQLTGSYFAIFIALASAYLLALAIVHWLKPDLRPAELGGLEAK